MKKSLIIVSLIGCSSSASLMDPATVDTDASVDASVDAAPDAVVIDAGADAHACARSYQAAPDGSVWAMYGTDRYDVKQPADYVCDVACGAGGPYPYTLLQLSEVTTYGHPRGPSDCTQDTNAPRLFCCATLVCTRHDTYDPYCAAHDAGAHTQGYRCDGPSSEPRPTRPGCIAMPGSTNPAEFCCLP